MSRIQVIHDPEPELLDRLGVRGWPIWTKEVSEFEWFYDEEETCWFLDGDVEVVAADGTERARFGKGDLVTFARGLQCTWKVLAPVRKHYRFG